VRQSGGFVRIDSHPGAGTNVRLYLPADEMTSENQAQTGASERSNPSEFRTTKGTILVVEDQENVRGQIAEALAEMGCTVAQAKDGPEGLRIVPSGIALDLIITDVGLPGLNGRQLADAARAMRPNLPILLITGFAGNALDDWGLPAGIEVLRKPFSLDEITDRVRKMLEPSNPSI
jgi:CheY-like chemotaxis protein